VTPHDAERHLIEALGKLAEILDAANNRVRIEAEARLGQPPVPASEVTVMGVVLHQPDSTAAGIARASGVSLATVQQAIRSLRHREMLEVTPAAEHPAGNTEGATTYRASAVGVSIREEALQIGAKHLRYALSGISPHDQAQLAQARGAIEALAAALGYKPVHDLYRAGRGEAEAAGPDAGGDGGGPPAAGPPGPRVSAWPWRSSSR